MNERKTCDFAAPGEAIRRSRACDPSCDREPERAAEVPNPSPTQLRLLAAGGGPGKYSCAVAKPRHNGAVRTWDEVGRQRRRLNAIVTDSWKWATCVLLWLLRSDTR